MSAPDPRQTILLGSGIAGILFVIFFALVSVFGGLPPSLSAACAVLFALAGAGILYATKGTCKYIVTDQRLLVVSGFSHEVQDSCDLEEISALTPVKLTKSLKVECKSGKIIRLWAVANEQAAQQALLPNSQDQQ